MGVMRQGKLAVVLGIEVDNLFGCYVNANCDIAKIRQQLDYYHSRGVRHVFPIHFYDNQFGGSALQNFLVTTSLRLKAPATKQTCTGWIYGYDNNQCNARGLSQLGQTLIRELALRGMIIDTDHLSAKSFNDAMSILEPLGYPVLAGHAGFNAITRGDKSNEGNRTPTELRRIAGVKGMIGVIPHQGGVSDIATELGSSMIAHSCGNSSETVAQAYLHAVHQMPGRPVGVGTDFNGFAGEPGPRFGGDACPGGTAPGHQSKAALVYPFTLTARTGSIQLDRFKVGSRIYDFNTDGLAHIGLVPDMIADWKAMGMTQADMEPLFDSAAGYARLWHQARDVSRGAPVCVKCKST